jgi:hypothetical protein
MIKKLGVAIIRTDQSASANESKSILPHHKVFACFFQIRVEYSFSAIDRALIQTKKACTKRISCRKKKIYKILK